MESTYDPRTRADEPRIDTTTDVHPHRTEPQTRRARSVGSLFSELWRETTHLVHEEAELAKADLNEKTNQITGAVGAIATGGAIVFAGLVILLIAASNGLAMVLPLEWAPWLAPLIVAVVAMLIGYAIFAGGKNKLEPRELKPTRTMESLRRDGRLVKEHVK